MTGIDHTNPFEDGTGEVDPEQDQPAPDAAPAPAEDSVTIADGSFHALDPAFVTTERIGWWISEGILGLGTIAAIVVIWVVGPIPLWVRLVVTAVTIALCGLLALGAMWHPRRVYDTTRYAVSPLGVTIHRGIWWKSIIHVPRSRIQHTDVLQGPIARKFGLGMLTMHTAGTVNAAVNLDGLPHDRAIQIRDYLIQRSGSDGV